MQGFREEVILGHSSSFEGALLASERSTYQDIAIYDTSAFGRVLTLDGLLQTSERDEFCYHEMLVHVPLLSIRRPTSVLIIGGGDGGTLRHVLMHPSVERAVMCEIDERVTEMCRQHMPSLGGDAFDDPRATVIFGDGVAFMREAAETFDAIIVDSSDPIGPGEGLFTAGFYRDAATRLSPGGLVAVQSGSPLFQQDELHQAHRNMCEAFPDVRVYLGAVPAYPGTLWSYTMGGNRIEHEPSIAARRALDRGIVTRYWSPELHAGAFGLPLLVQDVLRSDGPPRTWGPSPEARRGAIPGR